MKCLSIKTVLSTLPVFARAGVASLSLLLAMPMAATARGGSIFDDDWAPPKAIARQPVTPSVPTSNPATPAAAPANPANPSAPAPDEPHRRAVPAKLDLARSHLLLREAYAGQLKDRSMAGRKKLALALLDEAKKTTDNPTDKFALGIGAIEASEDGGDLRLGFQAADLLARDFELDALSIKTEAALRTNLHGDSPAAAAENVKAVLELIDPLEGADEFAIARKLLALARPVAAGDASTLDAIQKLTGNMEILRAARERLAKQLEKLKASPDDPAANMAVGSYLCFSSDNWEKGLPLLAKGSDNGLKQLAIEELAHPTKPESVMNLADGWWNISAKQAEADRFSIRRHSASLYGGCLEQATGLRHKLMEARIAEVAAGEAASPTTRAHASRAGMESFTNALGMKFVRIKPGEFVMGSPEDEDGHVGNERQHEVKITKPFMMAITPVTQKQWEAIMGNNPSRFKGDNLPVEQVSWNDAVAFCKKLGQQDGKHYRLPTEAEWEYACRAGTTTAYNWGPMISPDKANYNHPGSPGKTTPVGSYPPNKWGLYDMHGNVRQWCGDVAGDYPGGSVVDPVGGEPDADAKHVQRGGSWYYQPDVCRSARRDSAPPNNRADTLGCRVVLDLDSRS